jgi:hypothetical protein
VLTEDIADDLEPEAANPSSPPESAEAANPSSPPEPAALRANGKLPTHLRINHRDKRIRDWLIEAGYGNDIPDRNAIRRAWRRLGL